MPKTNQEVGQRLIDEQSEPGRSPWVSVPKQGLLSVQAWARRWNGASVQLELSHDKIHSVEIDGALLDEANEGVLGIPSGVYLRGLVLGDPKELVVSLAPVE